MNDRLDIYINGVKQLPTPPVLMIKLIAAFRRADPDADEVSQLLSHDPSLTAEVLRRCNSASLGGDEVTVDIFDAIMRIGFYPVYQIAVAKLGSKAMATEKPIGCISPDELWRHSAATAVLSGMVAKVAGEAEGMAYTGGLLHDIGKMVLACAEGAKYEALMRHVGTCATALENAEKCVFGFGHGAVGARLLERWNVPKDIATPICHHHDRVWPEGFARFSAIISLGNILAHELEGATADAPRELPEADPALEILSITKEQLPDLMQRAKKDIDDLLGAFQAAAAT